MKKPLKCEHCEYTCSKKSHLYEHIGAVHEGKKPFKCESCGYTSDYKGHVNRHVALVHKAKKEDINALKI